MALLAVDWNQTDPLRGQNIETQISGLDSLGKDTTVTYLDDSVQMIGVGGEDDDQSRVVLLVTTWLNSHRWAAVEASLKHPSTTGNGTIAPLLNSNIVSVNLVQRDSRHLDKATVRIR